MIRVLLIDEEEMSRRGLSAALSEAPDIVLVGQARPGIDALACLQATDPDIVLFSTGLHDQWIQSVDELLAGAAGGQVRRLIVVTGAESGVMLLPAVRAGVAGVLLRSLSGGELTYAVRRVANGHCVLSPELTADLIGLVRRMPEICTAADHIESLSPRERQVLSGLAAGMSNSEIAEECHLTIATVKTYVSNILAKLGVRDRIQAALLGQRARLGL